MSVIFDSSHGQQLRINTIGSWLRHEFGKKMIKLSIDAGFTCPNRDGTRGTGGCLFCSDAGSGDHASQLTYRYERMCAVIGEALDSQIELLKSKWPRAGYIAYFQSNTNTYGPADLLRSLYEAALARPDVCGIAIATRPDCLSDEVLDLLEELNEKTFLWVELGLQSVHEKTIGDMNLCYTLKDYDGAVQALHDRRIRAVTHLILGLPGEDRDMMLDSIRYVCRPVSCASDPERHIFGLKLHMLNVVSDSDLPDRYPDYVPFDSIDEYTDLAVEALEIVPSEITIHRIYADAPRDTLIAPTWARQKRLVLNDIHRKLRERDTWQGRLARIDADRGL